MMVEFLALTLPMLALAVVLWSMRYSTARREVDRLVRRGGLPYEQQWAELAQRRLAGRQGLLAIGLGLGILLTGAVLAAAGDHWPDGRPVSWFFAGAVFAGGASTCLAHYRFSRRIRADERRTAALRPRSLGDYLSPFEVVGQFVLVLVPAFVAVLGVLVLGSADRPGRGWTLAVGGLVALLLSGVGCWLQRIMLSVNQPAGDQLELRWQEALRAVALRDLAGVTSLVCWMLGAAAFSFDFPADLPGWVGPLVNVVFGLATAVLIGSGVIALTRHGLRRFERVTG